ncbi:MAG TPA: glycoside hydrolase family 3 C-terminal domain-containing protein [Candidatus Limnocylindrales bacterium]|nr:glycoside hydrolase family 3 C-terminal domain-containing protein [Candidatus Limnocylindrales bacterium]
MNKTAKTAASIFIAITFCLTLIAIAPTIGHPAAPPQDDLDRQVEKILSQMTLDEKLDYVGGLEGPKGANMYIRPVDRVGLPGFKMSDGPLGVRTWGPSMGYPAGIMMAASWDTAAEHEDGVEMGKDARARGVDFILGPGVNIYRAPMCGRNFEYFGEDPYLASRMAVAVIEGIQSEGVSATVKHFVANNQEYNRHNVSSDIDERTLREIYLPAFEAAVKEAKVGAMMDSYNLVNGEHMTQNKELMTDLVKKEWGFQGMIMSDWDATYNGVAAANAGLDLEMPFAKFMTRATLAPAVQDGKVSVSTIDDKVRRILRTALRFGFIERAKETPKESLMNEDGRKAALHAAESGIVMLKNEGVLPLDRSRLRSVAVIGPRAWPGVPSGGGSSHVDPILSVSFLDGISNELMHSGVKVLYAPGMPKPEEVYDATNFSTTEDGKTPGLSGEYFDNPDLQGAPAVTRTDEHVNFRWGHSGYKAGGPTRDYSARWTGYYIPSTAGEHTFYVGGRDGFRLYIDDKLVMDQWEWESTDLELETLKLEAGKPYKVRLEYFVKRESSAIGFGVTSGESPELKEARETAARADAVILCVGFDETTEGEGRDRSFALPGGQDMLIREVESANKNTIVVLTAGGNVDMTKWIDSTPALLHAFYPGEEGGTALAKIVFGEVSPSGKLPVSFERRWEDNATYNSYYPKDNSKDVKYTEGVFLGYRHFDKSSVKPLFPFGYGLSYTTFQYGNLHVSPETFHGDEPVTVSFDVTNTGKREGAEVGEVYVSDGHSKIERPVKELKGFGKVDLKPGETKTITVKLNRRAFEYWDVDKNGWTATPGEFGILVGSSSEKIELKGKATLNP